MTHLRIVVLGTLGADPYAGMAWMHLQLTAGLLRLGHEVHYIEATSAWPYDPTRQTRVDDDRYAVAHLARATGRFGLGDRWAYRRSWGDGTWVGPQAAHAVALLAGSDLVFNVSGSTSLRKEGLRHGGRLVLFGTDPVGQEIRYAAGDPPTVATVDEHDDVVSYGENIGTERSLLPALPRLRARTRQPVLMNAWAPTADDSLRDVFTTVGNWRQDGLDLVWRGAPLRWSKHHEFMKVIDVPRRAGQPVELATNAGVGDEQPSAAPAANRAAEIRGADGVDRQHLQPLRDGGWRVVDGPALSTDLWRYRDFIVSSRAEFTVAREFNVLPRSGWFSERSACYLAAGRPVITQDTGFSDVLPTGEGLLAFASADEAVEAIRAVNADYPRHARAAQAIARDCFASEVVLPRLLADLGA